MEKSKRLQAGQDGKKKFTYKVKPTQEDRRITLGELITIAGRSRSSILRDIEAGRLPQPFRFPTGRLYWRLSEIQSFMRSQEGGA